MRRRSPGKPGIDPNEDKTMSVEGAKEYLARLAELSLMVSEQANAGRHLFWKYVPDLLRAGERLDGEAMKPGALIHKAHDYGGTVNKMTGDGIMAPFGEVSAESIRFPISTSSASELRLM